MYWEDKIWIAKGEERVSILPKMANRHGLIAGATGTGKTVTLKVLAESFSDAGVPVFLADVKGDLAGMCQPGIDSASMQKRIERFGLQDFTYHSYPTCFWDIFGEFGHPLRTTISEMGPTLLARLMGLNNTQTDVLTIVFRIADDSGLLLLDIKDLRSMLQFVGDNASEYTTKYGNISKQSVGAISRALIALEDQGGDKFFGEPALDIRDWLRCDKDGRGFINILHSASLINSQDLYATFMLWMLSELFEIMPEAGDCDKPKIVFFFDEAHLLFDGAPKALLQKIEQVVKLIRSKGIGIYFITQSPSDIPNPVLAQLGNRIQHALRAYTPAEQKAIKAAAESFRVNPAFNTLEVITELGIGEALVSVLDEEGRPSVVERSFILPPQSRMGAITDAERNAVISQSILKSKYDVSVDRDSAYEFLQRKAKQQEEMEKKEQEYLEKQKAMEKKSTAKKGSKTTSSKSGGRKRQSPLEKAANSAMSTIGREIGKKLIRGLFNNLK